MKSKSDAIAVISTPFVNIKAFIIFKNNWILGDELFLYQMSENCQKLLQTLKIENTVNLYSTNDFLIAQTKEGIIYCVNSFFEIVSHIALNIFSFCRFCILSDQLLCINQNQLQGKKIPNFETNDYEYFIEAICSTIQGIKEGDNEYLVICLDNGIIEVLKNEQKSQSYQLNEDKNKSIFVYDCCIQILKNELFIVAATNNNSIIILKNQEKQIINLSFSPVQVRFCFENYINPIIAVNKDNVSLITQKEVCKYKFVNITNSFLDKYFYLCTNEQIIIIDFLCLKKK